MTVDDSSFPSRTAESGDLTPLAQPPASAREIALPQDLRVPWGWLDLLLLAILALAGSVLIRLAVLRAFVAFGYAPAQIQKSPASLGLFALIQQALLIIVLLGYLVVQMRVTFGAPFWRTIGWRGLEPGQVPRALRYFGFIVGGFATALLVQLVTLRFASKAKLPVQALFQDRRVALLIMLTAVFIAPVFEETIFRGYIYPVVARSWGMAAGVLSTGILFGLMHAPQLWGGWVQIGALVVVGIIFSYARAVTRTVVASFLLHVSYNFFISFAFLLVSNWLRFIAPNH